MSVCVCVLKFWQFHVDIDSTELFFCLSVCRYKRLRFVCDCLSSWEEEGQQVPLEELLRSTLENIRQTSGETGGQFWCYVQEFLLYLQFALVPLRIKLKTKWRCHHAHTSVNKYLNTFDCSDSNLLRFALQWQTTASTLSCLRTMSRLESTSPDSWQITWTGAAFTNKSGSVYLNSLWIFLPLLHSVRFVELFDSAQYEEAALFAARSPRGVLRNLNIMEMFKGGQHTHTHLYCRMHTMYK